MNDHHSERRRCHVKLELSPEVWPWVYRLRLRLRDVLGLHDLPSRSEAISGVLADPTEGIKALTDIRDHYASERCPKAYLPRGNRRKRAARPKGYS